MHSHLDKNFRDGYQRDLTKINTCSNIQLPTSSLK